ncbi:hypothetical protein AAHA92_19050 [Salvia divinorum]|uniref:Uncharacterized protein n=1 Tax=Salvia divinorum TaxID=28513 RepID=A0ABD1H425_SALDI
MTPISRSQPKRLDRLSEEDRAGVGEGDGAGQGEQKGRGCRSHDAVASDGPATAKRKRPITISNLEQIRRRVFG